MVSSGSTNEDQLMLKRCSHDRAAVERRLYNRSTSDMSLSLTGSGAR